MAATVEELTMNFQDEEGQLLVKELDKEVLTKGTWATLMFKYQDMDKASGGYKAPKFAIRRFQKRSGEYKLMSKFTISSPAQAQKICEILTRWTEGETGDSGDASED